MVGRLQVSGYIRQVRGNFSIVIHSLFIFSYFRRIPTADKKRLKEKMEQWIPSDDYRERQAWLRQRMAALTKVSRLSPTTKLHNPGP